MIDAGICKAGNVHCHVGSLDNPLSQTLAQLCVHCHVGSLEIGQKSWKQSDDVHCHVGSLENRLTPA